MHISAPVSLGQRTGRRPRDDVVGVSDRHHGEVWIFYMESAGHSMGALLGSMEESFSSSFHASVELVNLAHSTTSAIVDWARQANSSASVVTLVCVSNELLTSSESDVFLNSLSSLSYIGLWNVIPFNLAGHASNIALPNSVHRLLEHPLQFPDALQSAELQVLEVPQPQRQTRRRVSASNYTTTLPITSLANSLRAQRHAQLLQRTNDPNDGISLPPRAFRAPATMHLESATPERSLFRQNASTNLWSLVRRDPPSGS